MAQIDSTYLIAFFRLAGEQLEEQRQTLCSLDGEIGDGDHGTSMANGFTAINARLRNLPAESASRDRRQLDLGGTAAGGDNRAGAEGTIRAKKLPCRSGRQRPSRWIIDAQGVPINSPLDELTVSMELDRLRKVPGRILVAGGLDKVPPVLATLRGDFVSTLFTDATTGEGILRAEGVEPEKITPKRRAPAPAKPAQAPGNYVKRFLNQPRDAVDEALAGARRGIRGAAG